MNSQKSKIVICQAKDGKTAPEVKLQQETVWLSQHKCAICLTKTRELFQNISGIFLKKGSCQKIQLLQILQQFKAKAGEVLNELSGNSGQLLK